MDFYKELIAFDSSTDGGKDGIADYAAGLLKEFGASFIDVKKRRYVWATFDGEQSKGGLLLSGHLDVVPHPDPQAFNLELRDGVYFGRGTCDMKGFCAAALGVAAKIKGKRLSSPVHFCFTLDEETGMDGMKDAEPLIRSRAPEWGIVGEPTMMEVVVSNLGCLEGTVDVKGKAAHSSEPENGISAINILIDIMNFINTLPGIVNIGVISGGTAHNILAENAMCEYQIRLTKDDDKVIAMIDDFIKKQPKGVITHRYRSHPPFRDEIGLSRQKMLAFLHKKDDDVLHVKYATEAGLLQKYGVTPVICGPGSIAHAHKIDEHCDASQLEYCQKVLNAIVDEIIIQKGTK